MFSRNCPRIDLHLKVGPLCDQFEGPSRKGKGLVNATHLNLVLEIFKNLIVLSVYTMCACRYEFCSCVQYE